MATPPVSSMGTDNPVNNRPRDDAKADTENGSANEVVRTTEQVMQGQIKTLLSSSSTNPAFLAEHSRMMYESFKREIVILNNDGVVLDGDKKEKLPFDQAAMKAYKDARERRIQERINRRQPKS